MSRAYLVVPLSLLISGVVNATANNLYYIGGRIGSSHDNSVFSDINNDPVIGGFLGYNIMPWFATEVGYSWLEQSNINNASTVRIRHQVVDLVGKFTWHITDYMGIYTKLGGAYHFTEMKNSSGKFKDKNLASTIGAGFEFVLNDNLLARFEYQYFNDIKLNVKDLNYSWNTNFYGLSLIYSWGSPELEINTKNPISAERFSIESLDELNLTVPFAFDDAVMPNNISLNLKPIIKRLKERPKSKLYITGYADIIGNESYNQKLSERRAVAVYNSMRDNLLDVSDSRIIIKGKGVADPVDSNRTEEGRSRNRRVEVVSPSIDIKRLN